MKHLRSKYFQEVRDWDRKHRLIGRTPVEQLYRESLLAARRAHFDPEAIIVDMGAGSGILGVAWLLGSSSRKVIFIEPDLKKASFMRMSLATAFRGRGFVLDEPIQNVSRETLDRLQQPNKKPYIFVARAFSSEKPLNKTLETSWIAKEPIFTFETKNEREFSLQRLKI